MFPDSSISLIKTSLSYSVSVAIFATSAKLLADKPVHFGTDLTGASIGALVAQTAVWIFAKYKASVHPDGITAGTIAYSALVKSPLTGIIGSVAGVLIIQYLEE